MHYFLFGLVVFLTNAFAFAGNVQSVSAENTDYDDFDAEEEGYDMMEPEGDDPDEMVEENLELPDIYENTVIYNGTINPEQVISVSFADHSYETDPYVNEEGQFSMAVGNRDLAAGDEVTITFSGGMPHEEHRTIEVQPAEEGMEIVESEAGTSNVEANIEEETDVSVLDPGKDTYQVETVGDAEAVYFGFEGDPVTNERQLEHISGSTYQTYFNELEPGQTVYFHIVASGVTATIEEQVPNDNDEDIVEENAEALSNENNSEDGASEESNEAEDDYSDLLLWSVAGLVVVGAFVGGWALIRTG